MEDMGWKYKRTECGICDPYQEEKTLSYNLKIEALLSSWGQQLTSSTGNLMLNRRTSILFKWHRLGNSTANREEGITFVFA